MTERTTPEDSGCSRNRPGAIVNGARTRADTRREALERLEKAGDPAAVIRQLTPRERNFCKEYLVDYNATAAATRAGYTGRNLEKTAHQVSKRPLVMAYIDYLQQAKTDSIAAYDPDYVLSRVAAIIEKTDAKDSDKLRGLELLARHLGMLRDRTEISGPDGEAIAIEERKIEETAESFTRDLIAIANKKKPALSLV